MSSAEEDEEMRQALEEEEEERPRSAVQGKSRVFRHGAEGAVFPARGRGGRGRGRPLGKAGPARGGATRGSRGRSWGCLVRVAKGPRAPAGKGPAP